MIGLAREWTDILRQCVASSAANGSYNEIEHDTRSNAQRHNWKRCHNMLGDVIYHTVCAPFMRYIGNCAWPYTSSSDRFQVSKKGCVALGSTHPTGSSKRPVQVQNKGWLVSMGGAYGRCSRAVRRKDSQKT